MSKQILKMYLCFPYTIGILLYSSLFLAFTYMYIFQIAHTLNYQIVVNVGGGGGKIAPLFDQPRWYIGSRRVKPQEPHQEERVEVLMV